MVCVTSWRLFRECVPPAGQSLHSIPEVAVLPNGPVVPEVEVAPNSPVDAEVAVEPNSPEDAAVVVPNSPVVPEEVMVQKSPLALEVVEPPKNSHVHEVAVITKTTRSSLNNIDILVVHAR